VGVSAMIRFVAVLALAWAVAAFVGCELPHGPARQVDLDKALADPNCAIVYVARDGRRAIRLDDGWYWVPDELYGRWASNQIADGNRLIIVYEPGARAPCSDAGHARRMEEAHRAGNRE
jgi:hypothetical protein